VFIVFFLLKQRSPATGNLTTSSVMHLCNNYSMTNYSANQFRFLAVLASLFLIIAPSSFAECSDLAIIPSTCSVLNLTSNNETVYIEDTTEIFSTNLYSHCLKSQRCAHVYGLDSGIVNKTLFDYLSEKVITKYEHYYSPLLNICTIEDLAEVLEYVWPLILISEAQENIPLCPLDHQLKVRLDGTIECARSVSTMALGSPSTATTSSDNNNASVSTTALALLYVLVVAGVIILMVLFYNSFPSFLDLKVNGPLAKYRMPDFLKKDIEVALRTDKFKTLLNNKRIMHSPSGTGLLMLKDDKIGRQYSMGPEAGSNCNKRVAHSDKQDLGYRNEVEKKEDGDEIRPLIVKKGKRIINK
jgi:hypothetical protein